jgi:hypothetical protein
MMIARRLFCSTLIWALIAGYGAPRAQPSTINVTANENCVGGVVGANPFPFPCSFIADPSAGGLASVMAYGLGDPPGLFGGDVPLTDPVTGAVSDVIRFFGSSLYFYSAQGGGDPADVGLPTATLDNHVTVTETSLGDLGFGAIYIPVSGQPGFIGAATVPIAYTFISEEAGKQIPEPTGALLVATGLTILGLARRRPRAWWSLVGSSRRGRVAG